MTPALRLVAALREALAAAGELAAAERIAAAQEPSTPPAPANVDQPGQLSLEAWYVRRAELVETSSESQDRQAALAAGYFPSREAVRDLRARFAPPAWRRPGRRRRQA
jgi:hypothetical protein